MTELTLTFTFEDQKQLWGMSHPVRSLLEVGETLPFSTDDPDMLRTYELPELALSSDVFAEGSLLRCMTVGDAMLLKKIHVAAGYEAFILRDASAHGQPVVLTSWDHMSGSATLHEHDALLELIFSRQSESGGEELLRRDLETKLTALGVNVVALNADSEDHEDHRHEMAQVSVFMPGVEVKSFIETLASWSQAGETQLTWRIAQEI